MVTLEWSIRACYDREKTGAIGCPFAAAAFVQDSKSIMDQPDCRHMASADADPFILALEAWQFISYRTRCSLERYVGSDPASTIAWLPIEERRLGLLTHWTARELLCCPGFGRSSVCEVAMAMERYGLRFHGDGGLGPLDPSSGPNVAGLIPSIKRKLETQRVGVDRRVEIVRLKDKDGMSIKTIADNLGISVGRVREIIGQTQRIAMLRERYPLNTIAHI